MNISSEALAWIAFATTVVFGVLSIYFYIRSKRVKRLACLVGVVTLQKRSHPEVSISFRNEEIDNLSRMVICIWNTGTAAIQSSDIPTEIWPTLTFSEGTRLLSVAVLFMSSDHIGFQAKKTDERIIQFSFTYLNPTDGGIVEVLFEDKAKIRSPEFAAPIIDGSPPEFGEFPTRFRKEVWLSLLETVGGVVFGIGISFWLEYRSQGRLILFLLAFALFIVGIAMIIVADYLDLRRLHRRLPPFVKSYLKRIAT